MMWALLLATVFGMFGAGSNLLGGTYTETQTERYDAAPIRTEQSSWFDNGNQVNEESHGMPTNPTDYKVEDGEKPAALQDPVQEPAALVDISIHDGNERELPDTDGATNGTVLDGN